MSADPLWYKDAVVYQLHVKAFADSNGDGVGDFRGLAGRLDYLQDLGVTALWLLPFYPSPLRDDGYDIADYTAVHHLYGTTADFKTFLREAHRRGLKVITELVLNHTSDQHRWFQRARHAKPASRARKFYVWSDTPDRYGDARIIFKDFESSNWTWDPVAGAYFWHRFYHHQPDLNFDHPPVCKAMLEALDFWLSMGVDGLRLDAVPYLYEREGTNCENLPETHAFLKELRRHVDDRFEARMLLAEANQWPEDAVAYFGAGDEAHMAFHFPLMPRLYMALHMEDRFPIIDILQQTPEIPDTVQWALFLRNHDELTLEMVTDEDRDYMYRVYAHDPTMRINLGIRRRLGPLLGNDRRRIELMNALLFSLPGTPIVYYGDEIGMGDNVYLGDRNGVRTPMQWSSDRNAGFSRANPQRLYSPVIIDPEYHFEAVNVEAQQNNPQSLVWWMKRLIALRKRLRALSRGSIEFLHPENPRVLAFVRRYEGEAVLVVANLSRFSQAVELDLSGFRDTVPVEAFGRTPFPAVGGRAYFLTLAPHAFYWFTLEARAAAVAPAVERELPMLEVAGEWSALLEGESPPLERLVVSYLRQQRWFGGKSRTLKTAQVVDRIPIDCDGDQAELGLLRCGYGDGDPETYVLALAYVTGERARAVADASPFAVVARVRLVQRRDGAEEISEGILVDAAADECFGAALLRAASGRKRLKGLEGELRASRTRAFRGLRGSIDMSLSASLLRAEQSNTSIRLGDALLLKLFRKLDAGVNPEWEMGRFLTERTSFGHAPRVAAALEYRSNAGEPMTVAILQEWVPNEGDAWTHTLGVLGQYFEHVLTLGTDRGKPPPPGQAHPLDLVAAEPPARLAELLAPYLEQAQLLAQRTAELHLALASRSNDPAFAPEGFSALYQRSLYQGSRSRARGALDLLRKRVRALPALDRPRARRLLRREQQLLGQLRSIVGPKLSGFRIRCHGDYHLGQVLRTGKDFIIIDFEGEPARPISERRFKRTPLRDVAGMLRSFDYAALFALYSGSVRPEDVETLEPWADLWCLWISAAFLGRYLERVGPKGLVPRSEQELRTLLDFCLLDKAVYELGYELNNRPEWVRIPLAGVLRYSMPPSRTE